MRTWDGQLEQSYWANGVQPVRFYVNPIAAHSVTNAQVLAAHQSLYGGDYRPDKELDAVRKALIAAMRT